MTVLYSVVTILVLGGVLLLAVRVGALRERRSLSALTEQMVRTGSSEDPTYRSAEGADVLPAPVARYLEWALPRNQQIQTVRLCQAGVLRTNPRSERWMTFEAEHVVVPGSTGFVWNARVAVAPLLHVRVRDALVAGQGSGRVSLLSAFPVATESATAEMSSGSLHRYLAEAVWYPTALLPSEKLSWSAIDDNRALATLTEGGSTVSLEFRFGDAGQVTGIYTPARWGRFDGGYRQVAWEGHFRDYQDHQGIVVPTAGEVGWYLEDVWRAVWKGHVTSASYEMRQ